MVHTAKSNIIVVVGVLVLSTLLSSCGLQARLRKADQKYQIGEYYAAGDIYRSCYKKVSSKDKKLKGEVAFKQAECYRHINNTRALLAYQNAIRNKYQDSIVFLYYAQTLHYQGKYRDAEKAYTTYLEYNPDDYVAQAGKYACQKVSDWKKEHSRYKVSAANEFNDKRSSSFAPCFVGDNSDALMFTSNRTTAAKKNRKLSNITGTPINMLYSTRKNAVGKWEEIEKAEGLVDEQQTSDDGGGDGGQSQRATGPSRGGDSNSSSGGESAAGTDDVSIQHKSTVPDIGVCCFSEDGRTMYFTYSKPINGLDLGAQIYTSSRASGTWSEPQMVKIFEDSTITCAHPALSHSGDTLYFVSDAPGGYGGNDIYFAELDQGSWKNPTNLGPIINTSSDEMFPTVRKDGTLYFSSKGHPGYGGLDIFKAIRQDTTWLLYNMGTPFNSAGDDFGITFAGEAEEGYFSSNRSQKKGYDMIYHFILPEMIIQVEGKVKSHTGEEIGDATIRLVGNDGTNAKLQVRKDGSYKLKLAQNQKYVMLATARGYLNEKHELNTLDVADSKTFTQDFTLASLSKPITMDNIFYEFAKWELTPASEEGLNQLIKLLNDNPNITIELAAHTDLVGDDASNKTLSEKRAQSVVDYLISHGIDQQRLTPVGYGEEKPVVVDEALHKKYSFLPVNQTLDESFIKSLKPDQQEVANQINRRTEFRVLRTTYNLY